MKANRKVLFLFLTFILSFGMIGIYYLTMGRPERATQVKLSMIYMFIPAICVLIVEKIVHRNEIMKPLGISIRINKWFLIAWLIMPAISFLTIAISLLFPGVEYSSNFSGLVKRGLITPEQLEVMKSTFSMIPWKAICTVLLQGLVAGITINAVAAFGEELGWRGFLIKEYSHFSFWKASLIIGFIWGIWHSPLILLGHNYPQHPLFGVLMMTVWCILLSPIFNYVRIKSGSVIAASIMHGTLNGTAGIALMLIEGGNDLTIGVTGLAGMIAIAVTVFLLFLYDNKISKEKIMANPINQNLYSK